MKQLVEYVATSLADHPDQVQVLETGGANQVMLHLSLAPEDMGRLIGRQGRVANAIRLLVKIAATKQGKQVVLDIREHTAPYS